MAIHVGFGETSVIYADGDRLITNWGSEAIQLQHPQLIGMNVSHRQEIVDVTTRGVDGYSHRAVQMCSPCVEIDMTFRVSGVDWHSTIEPIERRVLDRLTVSELFAEIHRKLNARDGKRAS